MDVEINLIFYRKLRFGRQSPWLSVSCALVRLAYGLSFHFSFILFVTDSFLHMNWQLRVSIFSFVGKVWVFILLCGPQFWAFSSVYWPTTVRVYLVCELHHFLLPVIEIFSFASSSIVNRTMVPVDLWLSFLYVYFRERPTPLCVFVCDWQISLFFFVRGFNASRLLSVFETSRLRVPVNVWTRLSVL